MGSRKRASKSIARCSRSSRRSAMHCLPSWCAPLSARSAQKQHRAARSKAPRTRRPCGSSPTWFFFLVSTQCCDQFEVLGKIAMKEQLEEIRRRAMAELGDDANEAQIDAVRVRVLGRSGEPTEIMRGMRDVPNAERPAIGQLINQIKNEIAARIEALTEKLKTATLAKSLNEKRLHVTRPGMRIARGRVHPFTDL